METTPTENFYHRDPPSGPGGDSARYPSNHVRFSPMLLPLVWYERVARSLGGRPFSALDAVRTEYALAEPLDAVLGTREEIAQVRAVAELGARCFDANRNLSAQGRFLMSKMNVQSVTWRRKVLEYHRDHRARVASGGKVVAPLLITGTPRSGTTLLQRLISEDPNTRSLYAYELDAPVPPLEAGADPMADPRIAEAGGTYATITRIAPGLVEKLAESHLWSPTEMEECFLYMMSHNGLPMMNAPAAGHEYMAALVRWQDKRPLFRYERLVLEILQAARPVASHWTLKAPNYAPYFPLIFDEYPDARVVLTHRDPRTTLPSLCRLLESWCIAFDRDGSFDKHAFGAIVQRMIDRCVLAPLEFREAHPEREGQIFDCMYGELFADPIAMVKRVYAMFELEVSAEFEERMTAWLDQNKQGKYGRHRYSLEEYGFDGEKLARDWAPYMERYGYR